MAHFRPPLAGILPSQLGSPMECVTPPFLVHPSPCPFPFPIIRESFSPCSTPIIVEFEITVAFIKKDNNKKTKFSFHLVAGNDALHASWIELRKLVKEIDSAKKQIHELKKEYSLKSLNIE